MNDRISLPDGWQGWKIVGLIGSGSYGAVYKAERTVRGKVFSCAIKVISVPGDDSEAQMLRREYKTDESLRAYYKDLVDSCIEEIQMMDSLKGISNIVSIEDYAVTDQKTGIGWNIFIRMEFLQSLPDYYVSNKLKEREVIKLGTDICTALSYCEKLNIIHRDIKPDNIFISPLGDFKLGDFGLARKLDRSAGSFSTRGTVSFMAPEVFKGLHYGRQADIYSLGLVLYRALNRNRDPFVNPYKAIAYYKDKDEAVRRRISGEELPRPLEASEELSAVILKACSFAPDKRYQSAADFKDALLSISQEGKADQKTVRKPPADSPEKEKQTTEEHRNRSTHKPQLPLLVIACCIVVIAGLLAGRGLKTRDRSEGQKDTERRTERAESISAEHQTEPEQAGSTQDYSDSGVSAEEISGTEDHGETEQQITNYPGNLSYRAEKDKQVIEISDCFRYVIEEDESGVTVRKYFSKKILEDSIKAGLKSPEAEILADTVTIDDFAIEQNGDVITARFLPDEETIRTEERYHVSLVLNQQDGSPEE